MYKYVIAALCLFATCDAAAVSKRINPFGVVDGVLPCGSQGTIVQVRVTDCTRVPCRAVVGNTYTIEIDFIPSQAHAGLHLKATLIHDGQRWVVVDQDVPNSPVQPGNQYTFAYPMPITGEYFTGFGDVRIEITGGTVLELCGIAGLEIVTA